MLRKNLMILILSKQRTPQTKQQIGKSFGGNIGNIQSQ